MSVAGQNKIDVKINVLTLTKITASFLLVGTIISSGALAATENPGTQTTQTETHKPRVKHVTKRVKTFRTSRARTPYPYAPLVGGPSPAPVPACSQQSAAALEATYGLKGWIVPAPHFSDSLLADYGCWRTNLAKAGFGLIGYNSTTFSSNFLDHYTPSGALQQYVGQRPTIGNLDYQFLTYDVSQYGVPDGQLSFGAVKAESNFDTLFPKSAFGLVQASYYQTFLNKRLEFEAGYIPLNTRFAGTNVGGNVYNPLGPGGLTQSLVGAGNSPEVTPAAILRWNITDKFYDKGAISRSTPGTTPAAGAITSSLLVEHYSNPSALNFSNAQPCVAGICYPSPKELFINEIGYKAAPTSANLSTWVRFDSYYNTTNYSNLQTSTAAHPIYTNMYGGQILADQQIWQSEPGSTPTAYKGIYVGATIGYVDPKASAISQDYSVRIYSYGLFGRPKDQIAFIAERQAYSSYVVNPVDAGASCAAGIVCLHHEISTATVTYTANIVTGVYASLGLQYVDHPNLAWSPNATAYGSAAAPVLPQDNINHSLNFLVSVFAVM